MLEANNPLTNINEFLLQFKEELTDFFITIKEICFLIQRIFIDITRNFGCIKGRTATNCNNSIWFEVTHLSSNFNSLTECWIWFDSTIN